MTNTPAERATAYQVDASDPAHNAWVSASAGSGKTKVLVQRVLRLLLNGAKPQTLLAITYTRAAAAEMQNRITKNLCNWTTENNVQLQKDLTTILGAPPTDTHMATARHLFAQVLDTPGGIKIQTIHSFCQSLLAQFPLESAVPVSFKVLENPDSIVKKVFTETTQNPHIMPHLQHMVKHGTLDDFNIILHNILTQRHIFDTVFTNKYSVYKTLGIYEQDTEDTYQQQFLQNFLKITDTIWEFHGNIQGKTGKTAEKYVNAIDALFAQDINFDRAYKFVDDHYKKDGTGFSLGRGKPPAILQKNIHILDPISQIYQDYNTKIVLLQMAQNTDALLHVARCVIPAYQKTKHTHNVLDFDDIIYYTKRLFSKVGIAEWVTYKTDKGHQHILLDESQDTSPEQWHILRDIISPFFASPMHAGTYPDHTIFAVGDDKQSIYSFQGADPQGFFDNKTYFQTLSQGAKYTFKDIPLAVSFRTVPAVLQWVDTTMAQAGVTQLGTNTRIAHEANRAHDYGKVELLPVLYTQDNMIPKAPIAYAQEIAHHIKNIIENKTFLPSKNRLAQRGDILVLVKKRSGGFVNALIRTLNRIGVAVAGNDRLTLCDDIAVKDILALLQFSILPEDDLTLACILKSPLIGLNDADIFAFAHNRHNTLWHALCHMTDHTHIVEYIRKFLNMADFSRPFEIINYMLNTPCPLCAGGDTSLTGRQAFIARLGIQVQDVIDELLQLAMEYERDNIPTIQGMIDKIENDAIQIKRDADDGQQNQVRIMTVHGAKGLESPIVIVPDCYRDDRDMETLLWNDNKTQIVFARNKQHRTIAREKLNISQNILDKDIMESKRLLYVAMTRAQDMLICGGYGRKHNNWCWYTALQQGMEDLKTHQKTPYKPYKKYKNRDDLWDSEAHIYTYTSNTQTPVPPSPNMHINRSDTIHIPDWATRNATTESPNVRPLSPSNALTTDTTPAPSPLTLHKKATDDIYKRGNIMHQALENISFVAPENRLCTLQRYLQTPNFKLSPETQHQYTQEIMAVITTYPFIFAANTRAEVPISGIVTIDNKQTPVSGVIDRLCITDDTVWIIDFKSNRPPPETLDKVPEIYKKQLYIYRDLICKIYPHKTIRTALLWTYTCHLLEI